MSAIRHKINIAAPTRTVWNALTTEQGIQTWWADQVRLDGRPGGRIVLVSEGDDGEPIEERGIVHEIRPTRLLEIAWDRNNPGPTQGSRVEFHVARDGDETRVSVVQHGGPGLQDDEVREGLDRTWRQALAALRESLEQA